MPLRASSEAGPRLAAWRTAKGRRHRRRGPRAVPRLSIRKLTTRAGKRVIFQATFLPPILLTANSLQISQHCLQVRKRSLSLDLVVVRGSGREPWGLRCHAPLCIGNPDRPRAVCVDGRPPQQLLILFFIDLYSMCWQSGRFILMKTYE